MTNDDDDDGGGDGIKIDLMIRADLPMPVIVNHPRSLAAQSHGRNKAIAQEPIRILVPVVLYST